MKHIYQFQTVSIYPRHGRGRGKCVSGNQNQVHRITSGVISDISTQRSRPVEGKISLGLFRSKSQTLIDTLAHWGIWVGLQTGGPAIPRRDKSVEL